MRKIILAAADVIKEVLRTVTAGALALVIASTAAGPVAAAVNSVYLNTPLTASGYTFFLGGGVATFTFTAADTGYGPGAAVSTAGSAQVSTLFGGVTDFAAGSSIDQIGELYTFTSYPAANGAAVIPYSAADDFIGLAFIQAGAAHYGYAEVNGAQLIGYAYETAANTSIVTRTVQAGSVPEPATWAMTILGMGVIGFVLRRQKAATGGAYAA